MEKEFWLERWEREEIAFHQHELNPHLLQYWSELKLEPGNEVFVPLCGKSQDMLWLHGEGYPVLGVELSSIAVRSFFEENGLVPKHVFSTEFECCEANDIRILCGDFFNLNQEQMAGVSAVYDRASLVALPADMRERYAQHLVEILPPGARILLLTFEYPQANMSGPPFSVSTEEVEQLYGPYADIKLLAQVDALALTPRFQERGLNRLHENIFLLTLNGE
jgi:thiopurine S-methyltransferase